MCIKKIPILLKVLRNLQYCLHLNSVTECSQMTIWNLVFDTHPVRKPCQREITF